MTQWLVHRLIPDAADASDPGVRTRCGFAASVICIVCNLVLCAAKALVGVAAGSVSIVADALNNLSDASSNVVSLLGFKLASKPADSLHPYGHGRFEYLASLVVAVIVSSIGLNLIHEALHKILHPQAAGFGMLTVAVMVVSMLVKLWMAALNRGIGRAIDSTTLEATAVDSRNDVITSGAVLAASAVSAATGLDLDGWTGLAVGIFICWSGVQLVWDAIVPLLGTVPDPKHVAAIRQKILSYPGVLGTHDLMVHDYGPGHQFASAHVEMAGDDGQTVFEQHDLLDNIEQDFKKDGLVITLHLDPVVTKDPQVKEMHRWIDDAVRGIDPHATVHDLRVVPGPTHTKIIFDCVRPTGCKLSADELRGRVGELVTGHYPNSVCKITIDENYLSSEQ